LATKAAELLPGDHSKSAMLLALASAFGGIRRQEVTPSLGRRDFAFCTTVFNRTANSLPAILANVVMNWRHRDVLKLIVVTFGEDLGLVQTLVRLCPEALEADFLCLFSGGAVGLHQWRMRQADAGGHPSEAVPEGFQQYWHASYCKNASHAMAAKVFQEAGCDLSNLVVCNVDGDNLVPAEFLEFLLAPPFNRALPEAVPGSASSSEQPPGRPPCGLCFSGGRNAESLTGRIALPWMVFSCIGGYDAEGMAPCGYQDVDLKLRATRYVEETRLGEAIALSGGMMGWALPNDATCRKADRGAAKTASVAPEWIGKRWGQMNVHNHRLCSDRMKTGVMCRNKGAVVRAWCEAVDFKGMPCWRPATAAYREAVPRSAGSSAPETVPGGRPRGAAEAVPPPAGRQPKAPPKAALLAIQDVPAKRPPPNVKPPPPGMPPHGHGKASAAKASAPAAEAGKAGQAVPPAWIPRPPSGPPPPLLSRVRIFTLGCMNLWQFTGSAASSPVPQKNLETKRPGAAACFCWHARWP
jgi:hypothetical protein